MSDEIGESIAADTREQVFAVERAARDRASRLERVTTALAEAVTTKDVGDVALRVIVEALGAAVGSLTLLGAAVGTFERVASVGLTASQLTVRDYSLEANMIAAHAIRTGTPRFVESREDYERLYPESAASDLFQGGTRVSIPLVVRGRTTGSLNFGFPEWHRIGEGERGFMGTVAMLAALAVDRARLYESERLAREQAQQRQLETELIFRLSDAANRALELEDLYEPALDAVCAALKVERASILTTDETRVMRFRAWRGLSSGYRSAVDGHSPWRPDDPAPRPIFVADVRTDETCAPYRALFESEGIAALAFVPLVQQRRLVGKFMVYCREPRPFSEHDERLAQAIASQVSQAILRAGLLASERRERALAERLAGTASRLQTVTAALSQASSVTQVAEVIVRDGAKVAGAATAGLWLLSPSEPVLELATSVGFGSRATGFERILLDGSTAAPVVDSVRTSEAIWLKSRSAFAQAYPETERRSSPVGEHAIACLPLLLEGRCVGALAFTFHDVHEFTPEERHPLLVLVRSCAQAVGRARLFDLEAKARAEAEAMQLRTGFLLEASALISSSLDFEETLGRLVHLAVPRMADWCSVELALEPGAPTQQLAVAHVDPGKIAAAHEYRRRWPPRPDSPRGVLQVIRTGRSELYPEITEDLVAGAAQDPEHRRLLREVGMKSAMFVPMEARGRVFGAITFVSAESGRRYGKADVDLAELLGRRAGIAIDNALLYQAAQGAIRAREKMLAVVSHDLRNPLNVIQLAALSLRRLQLPESEAAVLRRKVESILTSADRMERLVKDLLDFAGMQGDHFTIAPHPCAVEEIVATSVEMFAELARERGVRLETRLAASLARVECDGDRVIQALGNLVSNAVRVTPDGGRVTVSAAEERGELVLDVEDTGPGIAPKDLSRLFEPYWRGESTTYKGTGLGLAITKGIASAHGGRASATSTPGAGSKFTLAIPLVARPTPADQRLLVTPVTPARAPASRELLTAERPRTASLADRALDASTPGLYDLLLQAPVPIAVLRGPDLVFETANELYLRLTGRTNLAGQRYLDAFPEVGGQGLEDRLREVMRTGQPYLGREVLARFDRTGGGSVVDSHWTLSFSPMRDQAGACDRVMLVCLEVTAHVEQRRELEVARGQAEAASRAKDEFFAMLGHELRNPIAPIVTALHLMKLAPGAPLARERGIIERQVGHVVRLVDDLLDVSRIARGRVGLNKKTIDVAGLLSKAIEMASPLLEERRHELVLDVPDEELLVSGDEVRLIQVATNLLTNAAKYTPPRGTIRVSARRSDGAIAITIADNGVGIDAALLPRIFGLFVQGYRAIDRVEGGLGLGLSIVRSLVELHGGTVTASSGGPGKGSEFVVRLPAASPVSLDVAERRASLAVASRRPRRVLVVDDNRDAADLLAEALSSLGHESRRAFDGPSALLVAAAFAPDVALLDLGLPVMDGWELARRMRELPACQSTRLFAVTGYGLESDLARSRGAGFEGHFVKPVDIASIFSVIEA